MTKKDRKRELIFNKYARKSIKKKKKTNNLISIFLILVYAVK